jgi:hypothetical protein
MIERDVPNERRGERMGWDGWKLMRCPERERVQRCVQRAGGHV